jgi:hypothetical protein
VKVISKLSFGFPGISFSGVSCPLSSFSTDAGLRVQSRAREQEEQKGSDRAHGFLKPPTRHSSIKAPTGHAGALGTLKSGWDSEYQAARVR